VLIADGLRPAMIGPYGNTWFDTPGINRLASESLLLEQCITDTPEARHHLRSILYGKHVCDQGDEQVHLVELIGSTGTRTILVTSSQDLAPSITDPFDEVIEVDLPAATGLAEELESTRMATFFAAAIDVIRESRPPTTVLLDCPDFTRYWDAPYPYRLRLADSEDPPPSKTLLAPSLQFNAATDDPDQLLDLQLAYGGQTVLFDQLLEILLSEIGNSKWADSALFCLTAMRSYPLGEHGVVGFYRPIVHVESVHVPLLIRWPRPQRIFGRSQQLTQPGTLYPLLSDWHGVESEDAPHKSVFPEISKTQFLPTCATSALITSCQCDESDHAAIQTHAWKYISGPASHLYLRPDDYWEFNDVASLCPGIMKDLQNQLGNAIESLQKGRRPDFQLTDEMAFGVE
jgi:hypothetical protein